MYKLEQTLDISSEFNYKGTLFLLFVLHRSKAKYYTI